MLRCGASDTLKFREHLNREMLHSCHVVIIMYDMVLIITKVTAIKHHINQSQLITLSVVQTQI